MTIKRYGWADQGMQEMPNVGPYVLYDDALTALLRAEYERGVMDAAATINRGGLHTSADYSDCILALLTQEGR